MSGFNRVTLALVFFIFDFFISAAPCAFESYFPRIEGIVLFGEPIRWETSLQVGGFVLKVFSISSSYILSQEAMENFIFPDNL